MELFLVIRSRGFFKFRLQ